MKKVLIVEDDQFLINAYLAKFSKIKNIKINVALDGNEALASIQIDKPDAIILDLALPHLNGFEFLKMLKDKNINIPTIVASNLGAKNDIEKAMGLGVKSYFIKSDTSIKEIIDKTIELTK